MAELGGGVGLPISGVGALPPGGGYAPPPPSGMPMGGGGRPQSSGGSAVEAVRDAIYGLFSAFGLNTPVSRALVGLLLGSAAVLTLKPSSSFDDQGRAKPFRPLAPADKKAQATLVPWFFYPLGLAFLLGFLL